MKSGVLRAMDSLYLMAMWTSGIAITLMSLIIPWGVFARYVLGTGSQWPEPVAILLMSVFTFFGAGVAYRAGSHIAVEMLTNALPPSLKRLFALCVDLLMLAACAFLIRFGFQLVIETMGQTISAIPWVPVGITYLPLPLGGVVLLAFVLEKLIYGPQQDRAVVRSDQHLEAQSRATEV
jgi:TRAP-type C4-dicarboxylate transport system permease small subunit